MYIVEISENKIDNLIEHMTNGINCFGEAIRCLEEMKYSNHNSNNRDKRYYDEDDDCYRRNDRNRESNGGRYSRY